MDLKEIEQLLSCNRLRSVLLIILNDENQQFFEEKAPEILTLIFSELDHMLQFALFSPNILNQVLELLVERGKPQHILETLLNGVTYLSTENHHETDVVFLFKPIAKVLQKIPGKRGKSLAHILSLLYSRVTPNFRKYINNSGGYEVSTLNSYLQFCEPLVDEISLDAEHKKQILYSNRFFYQRELLQKYLIMLGYHPFLPQEHHEAPCSCTFHFHVLTIFSLLAKMFSNIFDMFNWSYDVDNHDETQANFCDNWLDLALGNLAYLMFIETSVDSYRPYVYQHRFIFKKFVPLALLLMENDDEFVKDKGCWLFYALVQPLSGQELATDYFSMGQFVEFCRLLFTCTQFCNQFNIELCQIVSHMLTALDRKRCYDFLLSMLKISTDVEMHALAICRYYQVLETIWRKPGFLFFLGDNLLEFLQNCVRWKDRTKVDVLYEFHSILHVSELIKFVAERDPKRKNVSGMWNYYPLLISKLLTAFLKSLEYTRAFCKKYKKSPKGIKLQKMKRAKTRLRLGAELKILTKQKKFTVMHLDILQDMLTRNINMTYCYCSVEQN